MLIKNNSPRLIGTNLKDPEGIAAGTITFIKLKPGVNDLAPSQWATLKQLPVIQHMLDDGTLEAPDDEEPAAAPQISSLAGFREKEALKVVRETFDRELLELWGVDEKRKKVLDAMTAQLAKVTLKKEKGEKGELGEKGEDDGEPADLE